MATKRKKQSKAAQVPRNAKDQGSASPHQQGGSGPISIKDGQLLLSLFVKPGAQTSEVASIEQDAVHVRVAAPPRDGEANKEVVGFISRVLKIPKSSVQLVSGHKSRNKVVQLPHEQTLDQILDALRK
ncbi:hypothetical protein GGI12_000098 [Dipsacomyces acuminosporus]|nr:hypothetical protein GGI12_000098 [Dipsacomyces acuminosporus]